MALSQGWAKTPIQDVLDDLPPELKQQPDVIEKITSATDSVAAVCNMLTRISKVRSKKDLRWLAAELNIELPGDGYSLKQLKKIILDEARIHPDFSDLVLPEPPNQPPNNASGDTYEHGATTH